MSYYKRFLPGPGRLGIHPTLINVGNSGDLAPTVTGSSTVRLRVPTPARKVIVEAVTVQVGTAAAGSGAITAQLFKRAAATPSSGGTALTSTYDMKSATLDTPSAATMSATATAAQRTVQPGEILVIDIVAAGTVTTEPANVSFVVELLFGN